VRRITRDELHFLLTYLTRTTSKTPTAKERCSSLLHAVSTAASTRIFFTVNILMQQLTRPVRSQPREMSRINGYTGMIRQPVAHHPGTADVIRYIGGRKPVYEGRAVATFVDEVAGEESASRGVVDRDAALRVTWDVQNLNSLGYFKYLVQHKQVAKVIWRRLHRIHMRMDKSGTPI